MGIVLNILFKVSGCACAEAWVWIDLSELLSSPPSSSSSFLQWWQVFQWNYHLEEVEALQGKQEVMITPVCDLLLRLVQNRAVPLLRHSQDLLSVSTETLTIVHPLQFPSLVCPWGEKERLTCLAGRPLLEQTGWWGSYCVFHFCLNLYMQ